VQKQQTDNLARVKAQRDATKVRDALSAVRESARGKDNLMVPIIAAATAYATEQEICDVLRDVLGTYSDPAEF
jgi:methylmalonyl-CoA mutase N-terminal domain/subunit